MKAVIYTRVSTTEQTQNLSLPTQRKACEDYCRRKDLDVAAVFEERGESAKTSDRTELQRMLTYCRQNRKAVGVAVVYNLSRFSRNTGDHHALRGLLAGMGIAIQSATEHIEDSPTGRFMETIFSAVAQLDNDVKAERTKAGMLAALGLGRWTWQPPFGFARGQRGGPSMVPHPEHAAAARAAFTGFAGGMSKADVLTKLKASGSANRRGAAHTPKSLDRMLRNPLYAGRVEMPRWGISRAADFLPLISESIFNKVQSRLSGRVGRPYSKDHPDFTLRRFVRCGRCRTQTLTGGWVTNGRSDLRHGYYNCRRCGLSVTKSVLEAAFTGVLARLRPRPEYMRLFKAVVLDVWRKREGSAREDRTRHEQQVATLRRKLDRLADLLADGTLDAADYQRQRDRLREQVASAEAALEHATVEHLDIDAVLAFAEHALTNAARMWEHASPEHKRRLQGVFFPAGLVWEASGRFQTAATASAFRDLQAFARSNGRLASPTGFEPVSPP